MVAKVRDPPKPPFPKGWHDLQTVKVAKTNTENQEASLLLESWEAVETKQVEHVQGEHNYEK